MNHLRVLVVDDSALMRKRIREILESSPGIEVIACARNGEEAVVLACEQHPDVITMDINMPVMDGITALQTIMIECPCPVVMLSSLTQEGALTTFECLELGAVDFVAKPSGTISLDIDEQAAEIIRKVKAAARARLPGSRVRSGTLVSIRHRKSQVVSAEAAPADLVVAIGVSTGGPKTLLEILPDIPGDLDAAILIVQHMPEAFTGPFAQRLNDASEITIKEAESGDVLLAGHGYVARGGKHMVFSPRRLQGGAVVRYTSHPSDVLHVPSVDVMMHSAVDVFGNRVIGVLLTGMGADGADGMVRIRERGGKTIAEDESTAVVFGMPAQAIARGGAELVLPCDCIADAIVEAVAAYQTFQGDRRALQNKI